MPYKQRKNYIKTASMVIVAINKLHNLLMCKFVNVKIDVSFPHLYRLCEHINGFTYCEG